MSKSHLNILLAGASGALLAACAFAQGIDFDQDFSGEPVDTQVYQDAGAFDEIHVSAGLAVIYTQSADTSIVIESLDGGFKDVEVYTRDGRLVVKRPNSNGWKPRYRKARYIVRVSAPELTVVEASSGSHFETDGLSSSEFDLDVSSGASVKMAGLSVGRVDVDVSSGASSSMQGTCDMIRVDGSSGASVSGRDLKCETLVGEASSGASIIGAASQSVRGEASSGASITVYGSPTDVKTSKSSGGSVTVSNG